MVLGSRRENNFRQEEIMQAVVIADSFNVRFAPVTDKTPRVSVLLIIFFIKH